VIRASRLLSVFLCLRSYRQIPFKVKLCSVPPRGGVWGNVVPHRSQLPPSGGFLFGFGGGLVTGKLAKSLPDKPGEFAGHGHKGFVTMDPAGQQAHEAAVQAVLRLPTGFEDGGGLAFLSAGQFLANLRGHGVVLAALTRSLPLVSPCGLPTAVSPAASLAAGGQSGASGRGGSRIWSRAAGRRARQAVGTKGEARTCGSK